MNLEFSQVFWGEKQEGYDVLIQNIKSNLNDSKNLQQHILDSIAFEEANRKFYVKNRKILKNLADSQPFGSINPLWDILYSNAEVTFQNHSNLIKSLNESNKSLQLFIDSQVKQLKIVKDEETSTVQSIQSFNAAKLNIQKIQEKLNQQISEYTKLYNILPETISTTTSQIISNHTSLTNQHSTVLNESQTIKNPSGNQKFKDKEKIAKAKLEKTKQELRSACEKYNDIREKYITCIQESAQRFQAYEIAHIEKMKAFFTAYMDQKIGHLQSLLKINEDCKKKIEDAQTNDILATFIQKRKTGENLPEIIIFDKLLDSIYHHNSTTQHTNIDNIGKNDKDKIDNKSETFHVGLSKKKKSPSITSSNTSSSTTSKFDAFLGKIGGVVGNTTNFNNKSANPLTAAKTEHNNFNSNASPLQSLTPTKPPNDTKTFNFADLKAFENIYDTSMYNNVMNTTTVSNSKIGLNQTPTSFNTQNLEHIYKGNDKNLIDTSTPMPIYETLSSRYTAKDVSTYMMSTNETNPTILDNKFKNSVDVGNVFNKPDDEFLSNDEKNPMKNRNNSKKNNSRSRTLMSENSTDDNNIILNRSLVSQEESSIKTVDSNNVTTSSTKTNQSIRSTVSTTNSSSGFGFFKGRTKRKLEATKLGKKNSANLTAKNDMNQSKSNVPSLKKPPLTNNTLNSAGPAKTFVSKLKSTVHKTQNPTSSKDKIVEINENALNEKNHENDINSITYTPTSSSQFSSLDTSFTSPAMENKTLTANALEVSAYRNPNKKGSQTNQILVDDEGYSIRPPSPPSLPKQRSSFNSSSEETSSDDSDNPDGFSSRRGNKGGINPMLRIEIKPIIVSEIQRYSYTDTCNNGNNNPKSINSSLYPTTTASANYDGSKLSLEELKKSVDKLLVISPQLTGQPYRSRNQRLRTRNISGTNMTRCRSEDFDQITAPTSSFNTNKHNINPNKMQTNGNINQNFNYNYNADLTVQDSIPYHEKTNSYDRYDLSSSNASKFLCMKQLISAPLHNTQLSSTINQQNNQISINDSREFQPTNQIPQNNVGNIDMTKQSNDNITKNNENAEMLFIQSYNYPQCRKPIYSPGSNLDINDDNKDSTLIGGIVPSDLSKYGNKDSTDYKFITNVMNEQKISRFPLSSTNVKSNFQSSNNKGHNDITTVDENLDLDLDSNVDINDDDENNYPTYRLHQQTRRKKRSQIPPNFLGNTCFVENLPAKLNDNFNVKRNTTTSLDLTDNELDNDIYECKQNSETCENDETNTVFSLTCGEDELEDHYDPDESQTEENTSMNSVSIWSDSALSVSGLSSSLQNSSLGNRNKKAHQIGFKAVLWIHEKINLPHHCNNKSEKPSSFESKSNSNLVSGSIKLILPAKLRHLLTVNAVSNSTKLSESNKCSQNDLKDHETSEPMQNKTLNLKSYQLSLFSKTLGDCGQSNVVINRVNNHILRPMGATNENISSNNDNNRDNYILVGSDLRNYLLRKFNNNTNNNNVKSPGSNKTKTNAYNNAATLPPLPPTVFFNAPSKAPQIFCTITLLKYECLNIPNIQYPITLNPSWKIDTTRQTVELRIQYNFLQRNVHENIDVTNNWNSIDNNSSSIIRKSILDNNTIANANQITSNIGDITSYTNIAMPKFNFKHVEIGAYLGPMFEVSKIQSKPHSTWDSIEQKLSWALITDTSSAGDETIKNCVDSKTNSPTLSSNYALYDNPPSCKRLNNTKDLTHYNGILRAKYCYKTKNDSLLHNENQESAIDIINAQTIYAKFECRGYVSSGLDLNIQPENENDNIEPTSINSPSLLNLSFTVKKTLSSGDKYDVVCGKK